MDVSLIICTRDRSEKLVRCLKAIRDIRSDRKWELIVVDNASASNATASIVADFAATAPFPVTYVSEPRPGLANGHNAGLKAARGEILAFMDDDCYADPSYIIQVCAAFDGDPDLGYVSGRIMLYDPSDHPLTINESLTPREFPPRWYVQPSDIQGANMAFRRSVLVAIGGFDPLFGPGSLFNAEDIDAAARASAMGWKGRYCPDIVVSHHHGRKESDAIRTWKSYAIGRGAYDMKLLMNGEFWWFARSIYGLRRRYKLAPRIVLWEQAGKVKYAYARLS